MKILRLVLAAAVAAATVSTAGRAQSAGSMQASGAPAASRLSVGVRKSLNAPTPAPIPKAPRSDTKQNRAMMIVGGAAILTGALISNDAGTMISVGGAVVFLWGLYQFLQ